MPQPPERKTPSGQRSGTVVKFDVQRGFGFIRLDGDGKAAADDIFVHVRNVQNRRPLRVGQRVACHVTRTEKGLAAINVRAGSPLSTPYLRYALVGIGSALLLLVAFASAMDRPASLALWIGLWVIALSIATFGIYGYDKAQAISGGARVPEAVLYLLGLLGGTPGAFGGIIIFRHKTRKRSFLAIVWLITLAQIALVIVYALSQ